MIYYLSEFNHDSFHLSWVVKPPLNNGWKSNAAVLTWQTLITYQWEVTRTMPFLWFSVIIQTQRMWANPPPPHPLCDAWKPNVAALIRQTIISILSDPNPTSCFILAITFFSYLRLVKRVMKKIPLVKWRLAAKLSSFDTADVYFLYHWPKPYYVHDF